MNELERLKSLLSQGFRPLGILRDVNEDDVNRRNLPDTYLEKKAKAFGIQDLEGRLRWFPMVEPDAIEFAQNIVDEQNTIIGYDVIVYCSVTGENAIHGRTLYLEQIVKSLQEIKGWDGSEGKLPNLIEIKFQVEGDDYEAVLNHVEEVKKIGIILSLKNKNGFTVGYFSSSKKTKGQPFSVHIGHEETFGRGLEESDIEAIEGTLDDDDSRQAALALQLIYSQVSKRTKILVGWAAIEDMFDSKPERLLNKRERKEVLKVIKEAKILCDETFKKLDDAISNPDRLPKLGRNQRIANSISDLLNENCEDVYKQVRETASLRGQLSHTIGDSVDSIDRHISFIERVLRKYIQKRNPGINFLAE